MWVRLAQLLVNEEYRKGAFKVPIHLALGHEALAVALDEVLAPEDRLVLTHRNIAYNLARTRALASVRDEYLLKKSGLAGGALGSMNLANPVRGIPYTSSILGNDFPVGAGIALALQQKGKGIAVALGGDGSLEEGAFYETLVFAKSQKLPLIILIENNEWSMATHITERRMPINLPLLAESLGVSCFGLRDNDMALYVKELQEVRVRALQEGPVLLEAAVHTLGDWIKQEEKGPRLINYHAGPAPEVHFDGVKAVIRESSEDPVFVLQEQFGKEWLSTTVRSQLQKINDETV